MCKESYNSLYINIGDFDKLLYFVMHYTLINIMKLKNEKASRRHTFIAVLGSTVLAFLMLVSIAGATQNSINWFDKGLEN